MAKYAHPDVLVAAPVAVDAEATASAVVQTHLLAADAEVHSEITSTAGAVQLFIPDAFSATSRARLGAAGLQANPARLGASPLPAAPARLGLPTVAAPGGRIGATNL